MVAEHCVKHCSPPGLMFGQKGSDSVACFRSTRKRDGHDVMVVVLRFQQMLRKYKAMYPALLGLAALSNKLASDAGT